MSGTVDVRDLRIGIILEQEWDQAWSAAGNLRSGQ
jgi:hypothetical protein